MHIAVSGSGSIGYRILATPPAFQLLSDPAIFGIKVTQKLRKAKSLLKSKAYSCLRTAPFVTDLFSTLVTRLHFDPIANDFKHLAPLPCF